MDQVFLFFGTYHCRTPAKGFEFQLFCSNIAPPQHFNCRYWYCIKSPWTHLFELKFDKKNYQLSSSVKSRMLEKSIKVVQFPLCYVVILCRRKCQHLSLQQLFWNRLPVASSEVSSENFANFYSFFSTFSISLLNSVSDRRNLLCNHIWNDGEAQKTHFRNTLMLQYY